MIVAIEPAIEPQGTTRDYISYSAINTYRQCPLRYYFRYIQGLPEDTVSSSLVFGGAIHSAIEHHFEELLIGNSPPDHDMLLDAFWAGWRDREEQVAITFGKREDKSSIGELADRVLGAFAGSDLAQPVGRILGIEEELRGMLVPGVPDLLARIDLVVESADSVTVIDFKTARSRWSPQQAETSGEQLLLYSELVRQLVPGKQLRLEFAVITKTAKPNVECFPVTYDPARVARTRKTVERVWRAIEAEHFYPAPSPLACGSCPYAEPCRSWDGRINKTGG